MTTAADGVSETLDALHKAASEGDYDLYMSLFAPDSVYMGTDMTERWPIDEFARYVKRRFDANNTWDYKPQERHISVSECGKTAWFDEVLSHRLGGARGVGTLINRDGKWLIAMYQLTFPIPNRIFAPTLQIFKEVPMG